MVFLGVDLDNVFYFCYSAFSVSLNWLKLQIEITPQLPPGSDERRATLDLHADKILSAGSGTNP